MTQPPPRGKEEMRYSLFYAHSHVSFEYTLLVKGPTCFSLSVLGFVKKQMLHLTAGSARADKETCGLIVLTFCSLTLEENEKE